MKLTFCIILSLFTLTSIAAEIKFKSPELQKLHAVVKTIKTIPLFDMEICKVKLDREVINSSRLSYHEFEKQLLTSLKKQVSQKELVDINNVHTLKELFNYTNFSSFSGVLDNTFCFVNLPKSKVGEHEDRKKLFQAIQEVSDKITFAVLLDDGIEQGTNVSKLYVYGVDSSSKEAFAIKSEVE